MKFKINFKPYPGADYFTVSNHKRAFKPIKNQHSEKYIDSLEGNIRLLFGIPDHYKCYSINLDAKQQLVNDWKGNNQFILKDDPDTGIDNLNDPAEDLATESKISFLDLSYSFPQRGRNISLFDNLIIDPNAGLGIPSNLFFLFSQKEAGELPQMLEAENALNDQAQIYLLNKVILDYIEKGVDTLLRESNYKSAVLYQMIEYSPHLQLVIDKENRSKTMITAICNHEILKRIENLGYEVDAHLDGEKARITIANYPTHSKELIEMFSDRIGAL